MFRCRGGKGAGVVFVVFAYGGVNGLGDLGSFHGRLKNADLVDVF